MNKKNVYTVLFVVALILVLIIVGWFIFNKSRKGESDQLTPINDLVVFPEDPVKGDPGYQENDTLISSQQEENTAALYEEILDNRIYLREQGIRKEYKLNPDEVAIQCTTENLSGLSQVDLEFITDVIVVPTQDLSKYLQKAMPIFVTGENTEEGIIIHTILASQEICQSQ